MPPLEQPARGTRLQALFSKLRPSGVPASPTAAKPRALADLLARVRRAPERDAPALPSAGGGAAQLALLAAAEAPLHVDRRFLGACTRRHAIRVQVQEIDRRGHLARFRVVAGPLSGRETVWGDGQSIVVPCPDCGASATLHLVEGKYNEEAPCNTLCMAARGPKCECRCAGENHGRWFG